MCHLHDLFVCVLNVRWFCAVQSLHQKKIKEIANEITFCLPKTDQFANRIHIFIFSMHVHGAPDEKQAQIERLIYLKWMNFLFFFFFKSISSWIKSNRTKNSKNINTFFNFLNERLQKFSTKTNFHFRRNWIR